MKIVKYLTVIVVAALLSSCLGDEDNKIEVKTPTFSYVRDYNGSLVAAVSGINMYIVSNTLSNTASHGDCVFLTYTTQHGASSSGIYGAEIKTISDPIEQEPIEKVTQIPTLENQVYPSTMSVKTYSPDSFLGDRWLFNGSFELKDEEIVVPRFYYNTENQIEIDSNKNPVTIGKNCGIIDVRFVVINPNEEEDAVKMPVTRDDIVGDFSNARVSGFLPVEGLSASSTTVNFPFKFRYIRSTIDGKGNTVLETMYLGAWSTNTSNSYGLTLTYDK